MKIRALKLFYYICIITLCSCNNIKLGEYVYRDRYGCIHIDNDCKNLSGNEGVGFLKYMVERIEVKDITYIDNTCSSCVTNDIYKELVKITNANKNKSKLYHTLHNSGFDDIGSEEQFVSKLNDINSRKKIYFLLRKYGYTEFGDDFEDFDNKINGEELFSSEQNNIHELYYELKYTYNDLGSEAVFRKKLTEGKNREKLRKAIENRYYVGDSASFTKYLGLDVDSE